MNDRQRDLDGVNARASELAADVQSLTRRRDSLSRDISDAEGILARREEIEAGEKELAEAREDRQ